jgi:hypothetical protein
MYVVKLWEVFALFYKFNSVRVKIKVTDLNTRKRKRKNAILKDTESCVLMINM